MAAQTKYRWVKVTDICGETHEFEDCTVDCCMGIITIKYIVQVGVVRKQFFKRNVISLECLLDNSKEEDA